MVKKRGKVSLDADIKKAEGSTKSKSAKAKQQPAFNPLDLLPKEAVSHLENSRREALLGAKVALDGMFDQLIK